MFGNQPRDGLSGVGDDYFLALHNPREELGKMRLGAVNVNGFRHAFRLALFHWTKSNLRRTQTQSRESPKSLSDRRSPRSYRSSHSNLTQPGSP